MIDFIGLISRTNSKCFCFRYILINLKTPTSTLGRINMTFKGYNLSRTKKLLIFFALGNEAIEPGVKTLPTLDQYKVKQDVY